MVIYSRIQSETLAKDYLRRVREMVFLEKKNIANDEHFIKAAEEVGLDVGRFIADYKLSDTKLRFYQDMQGGREMGVRGKRLPGVHRYNIYVETLQSLLGKTVQPKKVTATVEELVHKYKFVATKEVAEILQFEEESILAELEELAQENRIEKVPVKFGFFWRSSTNK